MDLDGDQRTDILTGSWPGELYFFRRNPDGSFANAEYLKDKAGETLKLGSATTVFAVDWDTDGDLDLLVGNVMGEVHLIPNDSGTIGRLEFAAAIKLLATPETKLSDTHPVAADWDGDGKLDLVLGHGEGGVAWCRNVGSAEHPQLGQLQTLIANSPSPWTSDDRRGATDWGVRAKICVVDWNHDGQLDILLGDYCGGFSAKPNQTPAELALERQSFQRLPEIRDSWADTFRRYRAVLADESGENRNDELAMLRTKLQQYKDEIVRCQELLESFQPQHQAHGFVWLFVRKPTAN